jgi:pyruvate dehydrogenase E2 component (dihydrolipoamide acetyltransferase)
MSVFAHNVGFQTMETGNIASWNKGVGDEINEGDVICSIETDKAQVDFEATDPGFVAKLLVPDGANDVPVSTTPRKK